MNNIPENKNTIELDDETLDLFELIEHCGEDDYSISFILDQMPEATYMEFMDFMEQTKNTTNPHAKRILDIIKRKEKLFPKTASVAGNVFERTILTTLVVLLTALAIIVRV